MSEEKTGFGANEWLKIGFIIVSFFEAVFMGIIPVKVKSFRESPKILGVANAFSGGVFLAIALMHVMPEQVESYEGLAESGD
jgi:solute carrier family 39 (zinc transporter), member 1/2/3